LLTPAQQDGGKNKTHGSIQRQFNKSREGEKNKTKTPRDAKATAHHLPPIDQRQPPSNSYLGKITLPFAQFYC